MILTSASLHKLEWAGIVIALFNSDSRCAPGFTSFCTNAYQRPTTVSMHDIAMFLVQSQVSHSVWEMSKLINPQYLSNLTRWVTLLADTALLRAAQM